MTTASTNRRDGRDESPMTVSNADERISEMLMECADRLGNFPRATIDPRSWRHLLVYAPKDEIAQRFSRITVARPEHEWHEDFGDVLWWRFPIQEPPWVGSPLGDDWPTMETPDGTRVPYYTHWTPIAVPEGGTE